MALPAPSSPPVVASRERPPVPDSAKLYLAPLDILLQAVGAPLPAAVLTQVQAQFGPYLGRPTYPILVGNTLVDLLAATCLADRSRADARRQIGRYYLLRFRESILGRVMLAALPLMGWERVMRRLPGDLAAVTNYGTRWVTALDLRHWRLDCTDEVIYPEMLQGTCEAMGEVVRVATLQVRGTQVASHHVALDFRW